ncbi:hypothetical protein [Paracoccus mutanolyticus]|uniref:hypothetical protein n=1 Tax=Paracoccus mutanolyticus TaxID=1499308 RepID=UPI001679BBB1|nr:hypothetical protein [Paracoccus mutanolyticus]
MAIGIPNLTRFVKTLTGTRSFLRRNAGDDLANAAAGAALGNRNDMQGLGVLHHDQQSGTRSSSSKAMRRVLLSGRWCWSVLAHGRRMARPTDPRRAGLSPDAAAPSTPQDRDAADRGRHLCIHGRSRRVSVPGLFGRLPVDHRRHHARVVYQDIGLNAPKRLRYGLRVDQIAASGCDPAGPIAWLLAWRRPPAGDGQRMAALSWYLALMTDSCLRLVRPSWRRGDALLAASAACDPRHHRRRAQRRKPAGRATRAIAKI